MAKKTDPIIRRAQTGEPGNPGKFGTHDNTGPETALRDPMAEMSRLHVGTNAIDAAVVAAAGGHNALFIRRTNSTGDVHALVENLGRASGKKVTICGYGTTPAQLVGSPGKPGLMAQADGGILFIKNISDEAAVTLDALREPLIAGKYTVSRGDKTETFKANFQLIASASPCPCGLPTDECTCSPLVKRRYLSHISGPILDRFDLQVGVPEDGKTVGLGSAVSNAIEKAEETAATRWADTPWSTNAEVPGSYLRSPAFRLAPNVTQGIDRALERGGITMRGYDRCLRVAWTLADIRGAAAPDASDIDRALALRTAR